MERADALGEEEPVERQRLPAEETQSVLYGMVYDSEGRPVASAKVVVVPPASASSVGIGSTSGTSPGASTQPAARETITDSSGRFTVESLPFGSIGLSVSKPGFLGYEGQVEFGPTTPVAYVRLISKAQLLRQAEIALKKKAWSEALRLADLALSIDMTDPVTIYFRALTVYLSGAGPEDCRKSVEALKELVARGYREPYVYLLLADLYQYSLVDDEAAAYYLALFLSMREDPVVRARLESLRKG